MLAALPCFAKDDVSRTDSAAKSRALIDQLRHREIGVQPVEEEAPSPTPQTTTVLSKQDVIRKAHEEVEALEVTPASERLRSDHFGTLNRFLATMEEMHVEENVRRPFLDLSGGIIDFVLASRAVTIASIGQEQCALKYEVEHNLELAFAGLVHSARGTLTTKALAERYCRSDDVDDKKKALAERKEVLDKLFDRVLKTPKH